MGIRQTSLESFTKIKETGQLGRLQDLVYNYFIEYPQSTNKEASEILGLPINIVTARTNELVKKGKLEEYNKRKCYVTGRTAITWQKTGGKN